MNSASKRPGNISQYSLSNVASCIGIPPNIVALISQVSGSSEESTYLGIFRLYSFSRIFFLVTRAAYFLIGCLSLTASAIFLISQARSLLFFPAFSNPFEASIINTSESLRVLFNTITIVGIEVPKNMFAGKPMIASM